jgi:hypothetical protein
MQDLTEDLGKLFPNAESMDDLDAADFKDKAGKIWSLIERARAIMAEYE